MTVVRGRLVAVMARVGAVSVVAVAVGCAAPAAHVTVSVVGPAGRVAPAELTDAYETAASRVATVMRAALALPLPAGAHIAVYTTETAYIEGISDATGLPPRRAAEFARDIAALATADRVLMNHAWSRRACRRDRLALLAHELTHLVQYSLAQGRRDSGEQWLREGMADWVAARVVDHLGEEPAGDFRRRAMDAVAADLVALGEVGSTEGSERDDRVRRLRLGGRRAYALSFLLVDELIRGHGVRQLMAYFSRPGPGYRWRFTDVFGESPEKFIETALERLAAEAARAEGRPLQADRAAETVGSRWAEC